jgi:probable F420-dependent oxidoreductase
VFGMVSIGISAWYTTSGTAWRDGARRFEGEGYDTLWVADHVGMLDPFPALVAAAAVTERLRIGTYVLNAEFWNPLLLARVAATTDLVTDGRLVLGIGAGHAQEEFEQAGLRYPPPGERVGRLEALVPALRRLLAGETVDAPALGLAGAATGLPASSAPLLVGGNGDRVLDLAGREGDVAGLVGFTSGTGKTHADLSHWGWDGLADRLGRVRAAASAAGRSPEAGPRIDVLVQRAAVTDDPRSALADFSDEGVPDEMFDSPFLLVGSVDDIAERLARLDEMGVDGVTVFGRDADTFAPFLAAR